MKRTIWMSLAAGVTLTLTLASPASAARNADPVPPSGPPQAGLVSSATGGVSQRAPMGASPAGCTGQTDLAHKSTQTNESSVHGRTKCIGVVSTVSVTTYLYHHAWFGWNLLDSRTQTKTTATKTPDATPHYGCSSSDLNDFYGSSAHSSVEAGTTYVASTASSVQSFRC